MRIRFLVGAMALGIVLPIGYANAQDGEEREVTLVGCVMREAEYRDIYGPGLSGPRGPGIGLRNEYMLVDARETTRGTSIPAEAVACPAAGSTFPTAYELTGPSETEIEEFVGRRVELTGILKEANVRPVGTSGILRPTGGFDPLGHELHLFEVEVDSFRDVTVMRAEAPAAPAPEAPVAPEPEREVAAEPAAPEPEIVAEPAPEPEVIAEAPEPEAPAEEAPQVAEAQLPRTASPLPLAGLFGLLSLAAAAGIRSLRRRR